MTRFSLVLAGIFLLVGASVSWGQGAPPPPNRSAANADVPVAPRNPVEPIVMDARIGEHADRTRFVVEISDPFQFRVFTLAGPNRVVIDMPQVLWRLNGQQRPTGNGAVKSYRYGLFRPGNSRFVIDLDKPVTAAEPMILPPEGGYGYRVVIDLFPTTQAKFEQAAGWPADLRAREAEAERIASLPHPATVPKITLPNAPSVVPVASASQKRVIVVDAGHGGIDSGTVGVDGTMEKNLVLDEALRLRTDLQKRGYVVHLTRESDIYIPLRERVNIARGYQADLFISLHADSNPDSSVYGASVYTLSESGSDREAAALASKENQSDIIAGVDLSGENSPVASILIDLAQRDTMNRSGRFAQTVVGELSHATDILPREPHRSAAFVVLKAPDVPAVLIELGYLSNARDCDQTRTNGWRDGMASAIAGSVDRYFGAGSPASVPVTAQAAE
jgi:N-acetylmuramoyl-L-alanine amidase